MPLDKHNGIVCEDRRYGIGFVMFDGKKQMVVWVDKGALLILQDKTPSLEERAIFDRHREMLELIASANFDAGIVEPNGCVIIIRQDNEATPCWQISEIDGLRAKVVEGWFSPTRLCPEVHSTPPRRLRYP